MPEAAAVEDAGPATVPGGDASGVHATALRRAYGDRPVLRDVRLTLARGQTLSVIGPNGAGKTTLLRILATLLRPGGGELEVLGHPIPADSWRLRGRIGYLGHDPSLYRDLTVAENLRFHARLHRLADAAGQIASALETAELTTRADELVRNLSAGLAQRAAACRAVLHAPELLLLDEPTAHLDPEASTRLEPLVGPAPGRTRVVVTHDVDAALGDADRVLALRRDGSVAYEGAASGLSAGDARTVYGGER